MAKTDFKTIDEYHATFPAEVRKKMQTIREIIHQAVPGVEEVISYQIPAFKYKGYLIYYSAYAQHISISHPWSDVLLNAFETELNGLKVTKSVIQFPNDKPFPVELIKRIVEFRKQENEKVK